jgi:hypothetical protein
VRTKYFKWRTHTLSAKGGSQKKARALYDFVAEGDNLLPLKQGDIVELLDSDDPEWCLGRLNGKQGDIL